MVMEDYIVDVYPEKAQFMANEQINIVIELLNTSDESVNADMEVKVGFLYDVQDVLRFKVNLLPDEGKKLFHVSINPKDVESMGYGIDVYLYCRDDLLQVFSSSFDIVSDWRKTIRCGFLSDFYPEDSGDVEDVRSMSKLHLNLVQFYDWMYRHDELVPHASEFKDLMGRVLSLDVVKEKVKYCHEYGMKAVAYGAVYAASNNFYSRHKDWALYDSNNKVLNFLDLFFIMNISQDSPWHKHIIRQYRNAVEQVDFDGIHMDAYGFPKQAISKLNNIDKIERLEEHFPILINNTKKELEKVKKDIFIIFNNVGNWPVDAVASTEQDAVYIEVWKPYERYHHIQQLIFWAKYLSEGKPAILAAYLKPFAEEDSEKKHKAEISALILTAVITANGGYHLLLGEKNGVLTEGYYVNYSRLEDCFFRTIRNYYDFLVRYSNIFFDNGLKDVSMTHAEGDNLEYMFENFPYSTYGEAGKVWLIIRENSKYKTISFINLTGCNDDMWNKGKETPLYVEKIHVKVQVEKNVRSVFLASPDCEMGRPQKADYCIEDGKRGKNVVLNIGRLYIWSVLVIEME